MMKTQAVKRQFLFVVLLMLLSTSVALPNEQPKLNTTIDEQVLIFRMENAKWSLPFEYPRFPSGAQKALLSIDSRSGGETYYAKFPAGSHFDLHWHSHTEDVVVIRGKVTLLLGAKSHSLEVGSYIVIPAKINHEWVIDASGDCIVLVRRGGPADFNFVRP